MLFVARCPGPLLLALCGQVLRWLDGVQLKCAAWVCRCADVGSRKSTLTAHGAQGRFRVLQKHKSVESMSRIQAHTRYLKGNSHGKPRHAGLQENSI